VFDQGSHTADGSLLVAFAAVGMLEAVGSSTKLYAATLAATWHGQRLTVSLSVAESTSEEML
jgi:hypothetical protein